MKISTALLLFAAIILSALVSSVKADGGCVTSATSDRDQCLCGCIRSGYDCTTGEDLMVGATDAEFKDRCKSAIVAGGPCRWVQSAERSTGESCTSCASTTLCDGGGGDPPADGDKCTDVICSDNYCPGSCCVKEKGPNGGCSEKRLRQ